MTSLDQDTARRTQNAGRFDMQATEDGSAATWFLGIVVVIAIIGGVLLMGGGDGTAEPTAPVVEETAPATGTTD